jgi:hypothetical protein
MDMRSIPFLNKFTSGVHKKNQKQPDEDEDTSESADGEKDYTYSTKIKEQMGTQFTNKIKKYAENLNDGRCLPFSIIIGISKALRSG